MRVDPQIIAHQIANLKTSYPELAGDEDDWSLALSSETELDEMLTRLVRMIEDSKALIEGTGARMDELKARQDRFRRRIEAYRSLIFKLMQTAELQKRELPEATLSIRAGSPKIIIADEDKIPLNLCETKIEPNKTKIKEALASGPVPGVELSNAEPVLSVRVK